MRWIRPLIIHFSNLLSKFLFSCLRNHHPFKKPYRGHPNSFIYWSNYIIKQLKLQYKYRILNINPITLNNSSLLKKSPISFLSMITYSNSSSNSYFSLSTLLNSSYSRSFPNTTNLLYNTSIYLFISSYYFKSYSQLRQNISKLRTRFKKNYCLINP